MSNKAIKISTIVAVVLFIFTAAIHFTAQALAGGYGLATRAIVRQGMRPGFMNGPFAHQQVVQAQFGGGLGWIQSLTSFGLWVLPVILLGLLILAMVNWRSQEPTEPKEEVVEKAKGKA